MWVARGKGPCRSTGHVPAVSVTKYQARIRRTISDNIREMSNRDPSQMAQKTAG
jgi:hypothetical protein